MLFAYDWAEQALVFPGPTGKPMRIPTAVIRENGWLADDAALRRELPRADASRLARLF